MQYEWQDPTGRCWEIEFTLDREEYKTAADRSWGYLTAFSAARSNHHAKRVGELLDAATPARHPISKPVTAAERVERALTFVTGLEYAVDPKSKSTVEYHRTPEETLVDGRGDCKDLTYLMAGILSQPPFNYRTAMVILPEHMLLGVHSDDLPSEYEDMPTLPGDEYVAIETTTNREIGSYRDEPVLAIYNAGFVYTNPAAIATETERFIRNPTDFEVIANIR